MNKKYILKNTLRFAAGAAALTAGVYAAAVPALTVAFASAAAAVVGGGAFAVGLATVPMRGDMLSDLSHRIGSFAAASVAAGIAGKVTTLVL